MKHDWMRIRVVALLAAVGPSMAPGIAGAQAPAAKPAPSATQTPSADAALAVSSAIEATASNAGPAVVEIFTMSYAPTEGRVAGTTDLVRTQRASGSGAIVDPAGYIVTNAHVVRGAQRIRVEVPTVPTGGSILAARGRVLDGRIVGIDLETDLAVVKVEATGLPTLPFGDSDDLRAGQLVIALGSPLGFYNSVSLGVVSAVARQLEPESPMVYVQSDAAISSGSSGGPLVDLRGRIVGINTLVASREGAACEGLGFAAPGNIVRAVYEQLRQRPRPPRRHRRAAADAAAGARHRAWPGRRLRRRPRRRPAGRAGGRRVFVPATSSSRWMASRWRTAASCRSACIAAASATSSRSTSCARVSRNRSA
jgi:serine protease Do